MIFLSRIVPITGVALPGKNLPPTKTSEPAPAKPGAGEHSLANTGEERRGSFKLFILLPCFLFTNEPAPADPLRPLIHGVKIPEKQA